MVVVVAVLDHCLAFAAGDFSLGTGFDHRSLISGMTFCFSDVSDFWFCAVLDARRNPTGEVSRISGALPGTTVGHILELYSCRRRISGSASRTCGPGF